MKPKKITCTDYVNQPFHCPSLLLGYIRLCVNLLSTGNMVKQFSLSAKEFKFCFYSN